MKLKTKYIEVLQKEREWWENLAEANAGNLRYSGAYDAHMTAKGITYAIKALLECGIEEELYEPTD